MHFHDKSREHNENIFQHQTRKLLQEIQHPLPEPVNNINWEKGTKVVKWIQMFYK